MREHRIPVKWTEWNQVEETKIKVNEDKQFKRIQNWHPSQQNQVILYKKAVQKRCTKSQQ